MPTQFLFRDDAYLTECTATVTAITEKNGATGVELDRSVFYPTGGGQAGDTGVLVCEWRRDSHRDHRLR